MVKAENTRQTEWKTGQSQEGDLEGIRELHSAVHVFSEDCRETLEAYRRPRAKTDLGLNDLDGEQTKIYTTHRRVFDSNTATLMVASDMPVSTMACAVQKTAISAT